MSILKSRRFLPLFVTQFLGAFNDNLFKNAMVMLITFRLAEQAHMSPQLLVTVAAGVFILPFFLFSATAGQLADKYDRARIARMVKLAEIALMALASIGFVTGNIWILMFLLFGMGTHSAFFGPVKYAILPQHLKADELLAGNAYVEAATFLSILLGTIAGGLLVMAEGGEWVISIAIVSVAIAGYFASRQIPEAPGPSPDLQVNPKFWSETGRMMRDTQTDVAVYRCILAISWFWLVGATYLTQFPSYAKDYLHSNETVVTLLLTLFSIGIGVGSVLCEKLLKGRVQLTYVPLAAIGMAIFGVDLYFATGHAASHVAGAGELVTAATFAATTGGMRVMADLFLIAVCGGMFVVPLYAMVQQRAKGAMLARTIAGLNVMNSLFMVVSAVVCVILIQMAFTIPAIFLVMALCNILVAIYIVHLLPEDLMRSVARAVLGWAYGVEIKGMENFEAAGKRVLIVANHTSFLDAALIAAYLPVKITFAVNTHVANKWWIKPFLTLVDAFPLDPTNPMAIKSLVEEVRQDKIAMIFPEGRITVTGSLMKVYEGPGLIADKAQARLLPIRIDGAQYTPFSRLRGKVNIRWFPKITLTVLPPCDFQLPEDARGRRRRQLAASKLYDLMSGMMFEASDSNETLIRALMRARRLHGGKHVVCEDPQRQPMDYQRLISAAFAFARVLNRQIPAARADASVPAVGVLLPNMTGTVLTFFALHIMRRAPAMLNFSAGPANIVSACQTAELTHVISSRRFVEMGKLAPVVDAIEGAGVSMIYLEDVRSRIGLGDKLYGLAARLWPEMMERMCKPAASPDDAAVVLFTSGSEGTPKGVVLSHRNIRANCHQIGSRVDFGPTDIVFNCLPMFHSFGLTGGTLLPILSGLRAFYYPSPLHYRIVPELIYDTNATILFGTDTFLGGYARFAHPYDFHAIRYIFAGAEKLKEETRKVYAEKYGVRIFEGYGATETAPVISINTPMHNKPGSVGRLLPGITAKLEKVEGIDTPNTGKLIIHGPNIMKGYLKSDAPGMLQPPEGGWYDTGDIVAQDEAGYITIQGRMKRFAKIGGEMVSLTAVESALQKLWPDTQHAVVSVKDDKKGEKLILFTTQPQAASEDITRHFRSLGINELSIPRQIQQVAEIPLLGTGKTDYVTLQKQAAAL